MPKISQPVNSRAFIRTWALNHYHLTQPKATGSREPRVPPHVAPFWWPLNRGQKLTLQHQEEGDLDDDDLDLKTRPYEEQ